MPDCAVSDELLVQATGRGDLKAFEQIVARHQTWAWRIACRFTGNEDTALDIVQEAFLRILDASGRYRPTAKFRTYFYQVITRLCLDQAKKKSPIYLDTVPDYPDSSLNAADIVLQNETVQALRSALDSLLPNQRMAIILRYYEELNYTDIAMALETTPKAVERLLARGRKHLQAIFQTRHEF